MAEVFLDTNVLVYAFDTSDREKQARALAVLAQHPDATISTQVLLEWFAAVTRKLTPPMPPATAQKSLESLAKLSVATDDAELVVRAAQTSVEHQLSIWDAMVIEAAAIAGCRVLLSEDLNDGQVIRGVRVQNPFA
ncbi:PIN domain-containing protein [Micropruina sp.]|uniref:PIN domain-containing protein n=1 Tax=Micropruina sp. TaxID=2737536 RepID=UPI0039E5E665